MKTKNNKYSFLACVLTQIHFFFNCWKHCLLNLKNNSVTFVNNLSQVYVPSEVLIGLMVLAMDGGSGGWDDGRLLQAYETR